MNGKQQYGAVNADEVADASSSKLPQLLCMCGKKDNEEHKNNMGTFNGVFIPCALNIMGEWILGW